VAQGALALGATYGAMFVLHPTWSSTIGPYRIALVPDRLQARVQSATLLMALGLVPLGSLLAGIGLDTVGPIATLGALGVVMLAVLGGAISSAAVRHPPAVEIEPVVVSAPVG
jgi:hypothetical protein